MAFTIKVNGNAHSVDVDGDTPLLWVLRDVLGMTGTKFGCGMALCGACTVHIDGVATRSCITSIDSIGNSKVTTIEAIGATPAGAKIQKAWLDHEVAAMRLLPVRADHVGLGAACKQSASDRCRYRRRDERQYLPLRDLCAHPRGDQARRADERKGRLTMILDRIASRADDTNLSRRSFLATSAAVGGGLVLSLSLPLGRSEAATADEFAPNAFIRIGGDGQIVLTMPYVEMGQGTYTSIPDADRGRARCEPEAGASGACAAEREALRQPAAWRAGDRQFECNARRVEAAARGRRDRAGPCWLQLRPSAGASIQDPAARRTAR